MNNVRNRYSPPASRQPATTVRKSPLPRHQHRERDFGVGYGNSSGYASDKRYSPVCRQAYFRCA